MLSLLPIDFVASHCANAEVCSAVLAGSAAWEIRSMGHILIFDPDANHANDLAWVLESISCHSTICLDLQSASSLLSVRAFDAVIVSATSRNDWTGPMEAIRQAALRSPDPPKIVCLLRGPYNGPTERVYAARRGFKVIYEQ
jgi:hypothetical protein